VRWACKTFEHSHDAQMEKCLPFLFVYSALKTPFNLKPGGPAGCMKKPQRKR